MFTGTVNYLCPLRYTDLQVVNVFTEEPDPPASLLFLEAVNEIMTAHGLQFPVTIEEAVCLYCELVAFIEAKM